MGPKRKPDLLNRQGSPSKSGSKTETYATTKQLKNQSSRDGEFTHIHISRRRRNSRLVRLACWNTSPVALAVLHSGGLRHD